MAHWLAMCVAREPGFVLGILWSKVPVDPTPHRKVTGPSRRHSDLGVVPGEVPKTSSQPIDLVFR